MKGWWPLLLCAMAMPASAEVDYGASGYIDLRLISPADENSWLQGGLGKTRYGKGDANFQFAGAVGQGYILLTPELLAVTVLRIEPEQRTFVDALEAYIRYRPVRAGPWQWSVKGGAFFAPFSLENTELGWSSYWTITPSAINSWFGEELRTIGGEATLDWRTEHGTLEFIAAGFGWNDPAGVMMADRGWTLDDRSTGLLDRLRLPDDTLILSGERPPDSTPISRNTTAMPAGMRDCRGTMPRVGISRSSITTMKRIRPRIAAIILPGARASGMPALHCHSASSRCCRRR